MRLEQPAAIALPGEAGAQGAALEGLFVPGAAEHGGALVAAPHPLYGGSMLHPVCTEAALRFQSLEQGSLRFNWRGIGASWGAPSGDPEDAQTDYAAALDFLQESVCGPITAAGYSWGAATAVRAASGRGAVRRLLLVAPPAAMLDRAALEAFGGEVCVAVGDRDALADTDALERLCARLPRTHFVRLADTDHFFGSGPAALGREIEAWLRG